MTDVWGGSWGSSWNGYWQTATAPPAVSKSLVRTPSTYAFVTSAPTSYATLTTTPPLLDANDS